MQEKKCCCKKGMSCPKFSVGHLPIIVSDGTVNGRERSGRPRTETLRGDNPFYMNGNSAFTLIELLVVVLVIGILAAVALPQYEKAVWKSRYSQLVTVANSIAQAAEVYYLANGQIPTNVEDLSIGMNCQNPHSGRWKCDDFYCDFKLNGHLLCMNEKFLKNGYGVNVDFSNLNARKKYCVAMSEDATDKYNKFCKSQTGKTGHAFTYYALNGSGTYSNTYWYLY